MTAVSTKRSSSRLAKNISDAPVSPSRAQTRITSFVSAKKRAVEPILNKGTVSKTAPTTTSSLPATPIKIRKRQVEPKTTVQVVEVKLEEKEPAYKRFAHLIQDVPAPVTVELPVEKVDETKLITTSTASHKYVPWLPLDARFGIYEKVVFNLDSLCVLSAGRSQACIFHKIQKSLENVIGKKIPIEYLERIKTLWPEAYQYESTNVILQGKRVESVSVSVPGLADAESSASLLNDRKEEIKSRVQYHVLKAHNEFMKVDADVIPKTWHPDFYQESVQEPERTELISGKLIESRVEAVSSVIASVISTPRKSTTTSIAETPVKVDSKTESKETENEAKVETPKQLSLLERIRAKEQKLNAERVFGQDPAIAREAAIISQMEKFVQSVAFTFSSSKKTTLFLADLTSKLVQSSAIAISAAEVLERLKLLQKIAPNWIQIVEGSADGLGVPRTVKLLDRTVSLRQILDLMQAYQSNILQKQ